MAAPHLWVPGERFTLTTLSRHCVFSTNLFSFSLMTHPQINPTSLHLPVTSTDTGTHPQTPRNLCQEEIHSSKCQISSLLSSLSEFGGPRAPLTPPLAPPPPLCGCRRQSCEQQGARVELYTHVPAGPRVRADDRPRAGGREGPCGAEKGPRLWEPSCHLLSVPIRRAISLTSYFICVYLSVCLCLALSSDVSVSQPSDAPSAGARISEDRHSWHLSFGGRVYTCSGYRVPPLLWELVHTP